MNVSRSSFLWISLLLDIAYSDQRPRIWNGSPAGKNQFPYHVIIKRQSGDHICGGAILDDHWVLTAGHCFVNPMIDMKPGIHHNVSFRGQFGGNSPFLPWDSDIVFNTLIIHQHFCQIYKIPVNDIALLRASEPIISKDPNLVVKSIQIPEKNEKFRSGRVVVTGAGKNEENRLADHLRFADLQLMTDEGCLKRMEVSYSSIWFTSEAMICAGGDPDDPLIVDTCSGDSGGPLVYQRLDGTKVLVGIVSFGILCSNDRPKNPGVYTEVGHYSDWIKYNMGIRRERDKNEYPNCEPRSFAAMQTCVHMTLIISTSLLVIIASCQFSGS